MLRTTSRTRWGLLATSTVGFGAFLIALHLLRDSQRPKNRCRFSTGCLKSHRGSTRLRYCRAHKSFRTDYQHPQ